MTDEELMEELKRGGGQALQVLHQRYTPMIFGIAARSLGPASADDLVQEVLLAVWTARASYDPSRGRFRPWLLEIAHTRILNELRRQQRHRAEPLPDIVAGDDAGPDAAAWRAQRQSSLQSALAELPAAEGRALRLAFFEELSHSEVAEFLKIPLGTVKTRIRAGLGRLFRRLAPALGPTLLVLVMAVGALWGVRSDLLRHDRAVRMLSSSDSEAIRMPAAEGMPAETHGTFRWHPGVSTAVVTLSHAPPPERGTRDWAWENLDGKWISLCELVPDASGRAVAIAEGATLGRQPQALVISEERNVGSAPRGREVARWVAP